MFTIYDGVRITDSPLLSSLGPWRHGHSRWHYIMEEHYLTNGMTWKVNGWRLKTKQLAICVRTVDDGNNNRPANYFTRLLIYCKQLWWRVVVKWVFMFLLLIRLMCWQSSSSWGTVSILCFTTYKKNLYLRDASVTDRLKRSEKTRPSERWLRLWTESKS